MANSYSYSYPMKVISINTVDELTVTVHLQSPDGCGFAKLHVPADVLSVGQGDLVRLAVHPIWDSTDQPLTGPGK